MPREQTAMRATIQSSAEEFTRAAESQAKGVMAVQHELWGLFDETRRDWLKLAEREAQLASELTAALSSSRSIPEVAKAYQDWMSERLAMLNQEGQRMFANGQKFMTSAMTMIGQGTHNGTA